MLFRRDFTVYTTTCYIVENTEINASNRKRLAEIPDTSTAFSPIQCDSTSSQETPASANAQSQAYLVFDPKVNHYHSH